MLKIDSIINHVQRSALFLVTRDVSDLNCLQIHACADCVASKCLYL